MSKIDKIVQEKETKLNELRELSTKLETENRTAFSSEELETKNNIMKDVEALNERLATERFLEANAKEETRKEIGNNKPEQELKERFNIHSAIKEMRAGKFTGLNAEIVAEGNKEMIEANVRGYENELIIPTYLLNKRASTTGSDFNKTVLNDDLRVANTGLVLNQLGVTRYDNLNGKLDVPSMSEIVATFATENTTQTDVTVSAAKATLEGRFLPATHAFSREYLAQTSPQLHQKTLDQFVIAIERAIEKDVFGAISGITDIVTGTTGNTTWSELVGLESEVKAGNAYVMSRKGMTYSKTAAKDSGSGQFIWMDNTVNGYKAVASDLAVLAEAYFGDWRDIAVGTWGGLIIMEDPFTQKRKGLIDVQVARIVDTAILNQASFVKLINMSYSA